MYYILYVDDEPSLLELGKLFLEDLGDYTVTTALSAPDAIRLLEHVRFDAIISDYQMPGMDGIQFLIEVRNRRGTIPFILFTGRGREEVVIQAINSGADFYLQKGGDPEAQFTELSHKVRQAIQRREAETTIRDYERRETDIINFLPDATFAIDTDGVVIAWNQAMEDLTGVKAAEMLGKGNYEYAISIYHERRPILIDLVLHEDPAIAANYPALKKKGRTLFAEGTSPYLYNGRGATIWFTAAPLYNTQGKVVGAIESIRDITERKRAETELVTKHNELRESYENLTAAEEELRGQIDMLAEGERVIRQSEERLIMAEKIGHTGSWEYNVKTGFIWGSAEAHRIFGFLPDAGDFPINEIESCIPERERVHQALAELVGAGKEYDIEYAINPADGSDPKVIHSVARLEKDSQGNPFRVIGVIQEITERKQVQDVLHRSEEKYRDIFENSVMGLFRTTPEGQIINGNNALARMYGYTDAAEIIKAGVNAGQLYAHPQEREDVLHVLTDKGSVEDYEALHLKRDGTRFWVSITARIIRDANGTVLFYEGTNIDITRRKRAEEEIEHALLEKEVLLREIHHRVKNNLAGIISLIELQISSITNPVHLSQFRELETRIRSMALVHESLSRTKDFARINVASYTENLIRHLLQVYGEDPTIRCRIDMGDITLPIDTVIPCGLVMNEIITNSLKYAFPDYFSCTAHRGEPCTITLTMCREGSDYILSIADNGIGIPPGINVSMAKSLGLYLIGFIIAHQLRGTLAISIARGTAYTIRFPEPEETKGNAGE